MYVYICEIYVIYRPINYTCEIYIIYRSINYIYRKRERKGGERERI